MDTLVVSTQAIWNNAAFLPSGYLDRMGAHISGGKALLHRYSVASEQAILGSYNPQTDTVYSFPNKTSGSILDQGYTKVYVKDADLRIFQDQIGSGSTVAPVVNYSNRIRSDSVVFKTANGVDRNSAFGGRDVKVGDKVKYSATISSVYHELISYVTDFVAEKTAAVVHSATAASSNHNTQSGSSSVSQTSGAHNYVEAAADISAYDDLDGGIDRTYTVVFTTGGDPTTARFDVISSDGLDDQTNQTPAAFTSATNIGTKGAKLTFSLNSGNPVDSGTPTSLFVAGQTFLFTIHEAFTAPAATSGGTYTGTKTKTIIVTVTKGGPYSSSVVPMISVSSDIGEGYIAPFVYPSAGSAVSVGDGVTISFNQTALNKGSIYYISVVPQTDAGIQTLILKHNLDSSLVTATDGLLEIYIHEANLLVNAQRTESPPNLNWAQTDTTITLNDGMTATVTDGSLVDTNGAVTYAPIVAGTAYVEYREWDQADLDVVNSISDPDDVSATLGPVTADNPLSYGVFKALKNSNGKAVYYTPVGDPSDSDSWSAMLSSLRFAVGPYKLVPMTFDEDVIASFVAHCVEQSTPENNSWRMTVASLDVHTDKTVVDDTTTSDNNPALLTASDNPGVSGTQYTRIQCPAGNAKFVTNGVKAGDILRFLYVTDGFGNETYSEFTIASVTNEDELILSTDVGMAVATARKGEVHRTMSKTEIEADLKTRKDALVSEFLSLVLPDDIVDANGTVASYFAAAAIAGLTSSAAPHQPLHYAIINEFSDTPKTRSYFGQSQLRSLSDYGFTVLDTDSDGNVFIRKFVTTDVTSVATREESYVRDLHGVYFVMGDKLASYRGHANITDDVLAQLKLDAKSALQAIIFESRVSRLDSMIVSGTVTETRAHTTILDMAVVSFSVVRPYPLNDFDFQIVV